MRRSNTRFSASIAGISIALAVALAPCIFAGCANERPRGSMVAADPRRVEAHTAGLVPRATLVRVVLVSRTGIPGSDLPRDVFRFSPPLEGRAYWADERSACFAPASPLASDKVYRASFDFAALRTVAAQELYGASGADAARAQADSTSAGTDASAAVKAGRSARDAFDFEFRTVAQHASLELEPLRPSAEGYELSGSVSLADSAEAAEVEKALIAKGPLASAKGASKGSLRVAWTHESPRVHRFVAKGIGRSELPTEVLVSLNASGIGARGDGGASRRVRVPAIGSFEFLGARELGGGKIELAFSEELDRRQDLRGLVSVASLETSSGDAPTMSDASLRAEASGNRVGLFAAAWPASARIRVEPSLRAASGAVLAAATSTELRLSWEKPAVAFLGPGVILPTTQGSVIPIETLNISGVVVEAFRVEGDNLLQFLQVNDLDGSEELRRVGESVFRKSFEFGFASEDRNRRVRRGLDLGPLLAQRGEGLYRISVGFEREQVRYLCPEGHDFSSLEFPPAARSDSESPEPWEYVKQWPNGYDDYYEYQNDPCHPAFYIRGWDHDIAARRNVIVSDLGIIARRESGGAWAIALSDIRNTEALGGANVELYSYQRKLLASSVTDAKGFARFEGGGEPAFVVASKGGQRSRLKIGEGMSLAVSHFDVGGVAAEKGVKGLIYGERGVWRPGDEIKLVFVLHDPEGSIPFDHPLLFELEDPRGRITRSGNLSGGRDGFYAIDAATQVDAPTGAWTARVKLGGRTFTKRLRIETIMPNRLKLALDWGGSAYLSPDAEALRLSATRLAGSAVGALDADVSATFSATVTSFAAFPGFSFDDPTRRVPAERSVLWKGRLDPDGSVSFPLALEGESLAPGKLRANILSRVFEGSGVFSSEFSSVDYLPFERYAGLSLPEGDKSGGLLTGKTHTARLALVDRDGKPSRSGKVEVALYKLEWRWWWEKSDESLADLAEELYAKPVQKSSLAIVDGKASWRFSIENEAWGRYLIRVEDKEGGHAAGIVFYADWPGWVGKAGAGGSAAALSLEAGKPLYAAGEKASVSFPSNADGRALVAVEKGGRLVSQEWVKTGAGRTVYEFPASAALAPNAYVHVTFLQPHLQTANDLPIRLYGVVPVLVEDPATKLSPRIEAPSELAPDTKATFYVSEASGRPMTCTLAVVDEGLLGLTRYTVEDPREEFYAKEASALASFDLYDYVAGAYAGELATLLAVGGSDEALASGSRKPSRFAPLVRFFPPFEVGPGQRVEKSVELGSYVGAVRVMVVAGSGASGGGASSGNTSSSTAATAIAATAANSEPGARSSPAYGRAELSLPVRTKLMVELPAPRSLATGEEILLPATISAFLGKAKVSATLGVTGAASLVGPGTVDLDFSGDGERLSSFRIKASGEAGIAHIVLSAKGGGAEAKRELELSIGESGLPVLTAVDIALDAGAEWKGRAAYPGAGGRSLEIEVSRLPSLDLSRRLASLVAYPHGCAEQTISKAFPQLFLADCADLGKDRGESVSRNVSAAIEALERFRTPSGAYTLWPGGSPEEQGGEWLTVYAAHFLVSARRAGYEVRQASLDPTLDRMSRGARLWGSAEPWSRSVQAYRLYVLALAGRTELGSMNRMREMDNLHAAALYRLAAAYAVEGMKKPAEALVRKAPPSVDFYEGLGAFTYGTPLRDRAVLLDALVAMGDTARALSVYRQIAAELSSRAELTTQEIGFSLAAALPFAAAARSGASGKASLAVMRPAFDEVSVVVEKASVSVSLQPPRGSDESIILKNTGSSPLYARLLMRGIAPAGSETAVSKGISLSTRYLDIDGSSVDPNSLPAGSDIIVEAKVKNLTSAPLANLALSQRTPSGWEIVNFRIGEELEGPDEEGPSEDAGADAGDSGAESAYDYRDTRDSAVLTYFSLEPQTEKIYRYYANKVFSGKFRIPPQTVEAMYDPRFSALEPGMALDETIRLRAADPPQALAPADRKKNR